MWGAQSEKSLIVKIDFSSLNAPRISDQRISFGFRNGVSEKFKRIFLKDFYRRKREEI